MIIVIPIAISGSGKSHMFKHGEVDKEFVYVCPDNIRKMLTGNISDQSRNKEVFEIAYDMVETCIKENKNVFFDATNVNSKTRKKFVNKYKDNPNVIIQYYVLPANIELSYQRIQNDLKNGVDRSNVPMDVLERQYKMYQESVESGFAGEHVHSVIFLKD